MRFLPLLALVACRPATQINGDLDDVEVTFSDIVPVPTVSWQGEPGSAWVAFGLGEALDQATPAVETEDGAVEMPLFGLKAGQTYSFQVFNVVEGGRRLESGVGTIETPLPPADMPRLEVDAYVEDLADGFVLTSVVRDGPGYIFIVDRDGDYVWWFAPGDRVGVTSQKISRDGTAILALISDQEQTEDLGGIWRVDLAGREAILTEAPLAHHDFVELPDDRYAWISLSTDEFVLDEEPLNIIGDRVLVRPIGSDDSEQLFDTFEDYQPPWRTCPHFDRGAYNIEGQDWTHGNALMYLEEDDTLLMSLRNADTIVKLDASTGEVLWQLGGRFSDFTLTSGDPWKHAHMSQGWDGGVFLVDNGNHRDDQISRITEYAWDTSDMTWRSVWTWRHPDEGFIIAGGDVRRMPSGDAMVSWSTLGTIQQVSPAGDVKWELRTGIGDLTGRVRWIEDLYDLPLESER
ncbi:MAG: aryl-sulfate sulfotransferase [Alphaproteobacteria bacterium]|nr:aryl-sulfate sulfotransferase [Alphaproteobacteria bacterium]